VPDHEVLVVSTMWPNRALPVHALFVQQRIRALSRRIPLTVCSPTPSFPLVQRFFPKYAHRAHVPDREEQFGMDVRFPRFTSIPAVAKPLDGWFVYQCLRRYVKQQKLEGRLALLDSHLAFPDGWAAVRLGRELDVPVTVTLRGHDINELVHTRGRRSMVIEALQGADRVFGVAQALCDAAIELGAPPERTAAALNGVDVQRFRVEDRREARARVDLPLDAQVILSVGHLTRRKGFHVLLDAAAKLNDQGRDLRVVIAGGPGEEGNVERELRDQSAALGIDDRVIFTGAVRNEELIDWYNAADVFCLASEKEGWPNVVLEALACGTPVVATAVWGTPEILPSEELGLLVAYGDDAALAQALGTALDRTWDRARLRTHAEAHSWDRTADGLVEQMQSVLAQRGRTLPTIDLETTRTSS